MYNNLDGIPTNLNEFSNVDTDFQSEAQVNTQIHTTVTESYINNMHLNADSFGGYTPTTLLSNFTNTKWLTACIWYEIYL